MWSEEPCRVLLMAIPLLVCDLRSTLRKTYSAEQLKNLDEVLAGCGIDMEVSKHLEIVPEADIEHRVRELALEMSGLVVLPWCLLVDSQAVIDSCFYRINVFGDWMYFTASYYRPAAMEVFISVDGVKTGGVMVNS